MASQVLIEILLALGFTLTLFAVGLVLERAWKKPWKKTYESLVIGWTVVFLLSVFLYGTVVGAISGGILGVLSLLILVLYPPIGLTFFVAGLLACGVVNHLSRRGAPRDKEAPGPLFPPRYLWIPVLTAPSWPLRG